MNKISEIINELYLLAFSRAHESAVSKKRNCVSWRVEKDNWFSARFLNVTEYSKGCFRFSNKHSGQIPKTILPFKLEHSNMLKSIEVTVHAEEINRDMLNRILDAVENPEIALDSDVFREPDLYPGYAWSKKAWDQQEANRKR